MANLLSSWGNLIYKFFMITSYPGIPETKWAWAAVRTKVALYRWGPHCGVAAEASYLNSRTPPGMHV